jgi:hypothetical protein
MSNVLDLKDQQPGAASAGVASAEVVNDVPEAILASTDIPAAVSWTAHHPLVGKARKRHALFSAGIVVVGLLISLWQGSYAPFFVLLVGAAVLELREHMSKPTSVTVDERGVHIDEQRYLHAAFSSFHIHRMPDDTLELSLKSEQRFLPHVRLPLGAQDPQKLHAVLTQYIPEDEHKIPYIDYYIRKPR